MIKNSTVYVCRKAYKYLTYLYDMPVIITISLS